MNFKESEKIPLQTPESNLPHRALRADAAANREAILTTAQRLFIEQGVGQVCMSAIAQKAGVGKGTLYRAFANKGELCLALMDEDMRRFQDQTLEEFKETHEQPALTRLNNFLDRLVHFMEYHAPLLREVQQHGGLEHDLYAGQSTPQLWLPWLRDTIGVLLRQAGRNGETQNLDVPYLVDAILAPLKAELFMYQREVLGFELDRISRGLRRLVLDGCRRGR